MLFLQLAGHIILNYRTSLPTASRDLVPDTVLGPVLKKYLAATRMQQDTTARSIDELVTYYYFKTLPVAPP